MFEPTTYAAVIPCFNESASITTLVMAVRQHLQFVLVVDDGSTDDTARLAKSAGAVVVKHERNLGKGAALKTGLSRALKQGYEWAVTLDGDGQHAPADLPALLRGAEQTGILLVIGNRMNDARKIPWLRRQVNRWMSRKPDWVSGRGRPARCESFRLIHRFTCRRSQGIFRASFMRLPTTSNAPVCSAPRNSAGKSSGACWPSPSSVTAH